MILARGVSKNGEVVLRSDMAGYEIIVDGQFLMSSSSGRSSEVLVEAGLAKLKGRADLKLLIAGLGLGFSLRTALADPAVGRVVLVELEPLLIDWHRRGLIPGMEELLRDPRLNLVEGDFLEYLRGCTERFDLIALDIDNGPDWLSHESNASLYTRASIVRIKEVLSPQGVLTLWSAAVAPELQKRLSSIMGTVTVLEVADHNGAGRIIPAFVYLASNQPQ